MSLQTLAFNCSACHILAKHSQINKVNNPITIKRKHKITKVSESAVLTKSQPNRTTESIIKNKLKRIAVNRY